MLNNDVLVICTYKRLNDLTDCLNSLKLAVDIPRDVIVVDGDSDSDVAKLCQEFNFSIRYYGTPAGLTYQRNFALDRINDCQYIFFVDDDTIIGKDYFVDVRRIFSQFNAVGVGVTPQVTKKIKFRIFELAFCQISRKQGKITNYGLNMGRYEGEGEADWLPGCSMAYRHSSIGSTKFDLRRKGYALGEDVDFSLRMRQKGKLIWSSTPIVFHNTSPVNRLKREEMLRMTVRHRWTLLTDQISKMNKFSFFWSLFASIIYWFLRFLRYRKFENLLFLKAITLGFFDVLKKGPLNEVD